MKLFTILTSKGIAYKKHSIAVFATKIPKAVKTMTAIILFQMISVFLKT